MNTEPTIKCPKCKVEIKLTEAMAGPLVEAERVKHEDRLAALRVQIMNDANRKATKKASDVIDKQGQDLAEFRERERVNEEKLTLAQKVQTEAIKRSRELDTAERELELTIEKRVEGGLEAAYDRAKTKADSAAEGRVSEREHTINSMKIEIENLTRKAEQGSQQTQGEVMEVEIEGILKESFPFDSILPVPKGEYGGDILQIVRNPHKDIGKILWEIKRTKNWVDGWLTKLRGDQRTAKAEVSVLVSQTLPKDLTSFALIDDVWVTCPELVMPLASILRHVLIEIHGARVGMQGQETKTELIYKYMTGSQFRLRVQAIVEAFSTMKEDLASEKKAITKGWAKRETQIERVMQGTIGMYGDLQGIAGKSLPEIKELEFKEE